MRKLISLLIWAACVMGCKPAIESQAPPTEAPSAAATPLAADTPSTTVAGNTFVAPKGWTLTRQGPATVLTPPEGGSRIALIDVSAADADAP